MTRTSPQAGPVAEVGPVTTAGVDAEAEHRRGRVKCVVWDLDNTVWDGILLEDGEVEVRPLVRDTIVALDERGILHSVASRNDPDTALRQLERCGLAEYFLHPQISWGPKSAALPRIAAALNIGLDALAFVDDQPFELDEVAFAHPQVTCVDAAEVATLPDRPEFTPRFVTPESRQRRWMYRSGIERSAAEDDFTGTASEFLATLGMVFTIRVAREEDLRRAEELTVRTHQLNSTGVTYSHAELAELSRSTDHLLLVAELEDRYGSYGTIGLALVRTGSPTWLLKLLLMSCRVMSRGVGTVLLNHVVRRAADAGAALHAEFVPSDRNRVMYVTYRFAGFEEVGSRDGVQLLAASPGAIQEDPSHLRVIVDEERR